MVAKKEKDMRLWLLKIAKAIGKSVVISLLVERNRIDFLGAIDKKSSDLSSDLGDDDDDEDVLDKKLKRKLNSQSFQRYIS